MDNISKLWGGNLPQAEKNWKAEKNEEMQNSTSEEYGELIALWEARRRYLSYPRRILMNTWKNELTHEEPPWRTPLAKGWWDRIQEWKG